MIAVFGNDLFTPIAEDVAAEKRCVAPRVDRTVAMGRNESAGYPGGGVPFFDRFSVKRFAGRITVPPDPEIRPGLGIGDFFARCEVEHSVEFPVFVTRVPRIDVGRYHPADAFNCVAELLLNDHAAGEVVAI